MVKHARKICVALIMLISGCSGHQADSVSDDLSEQESVAVRENDIDPKGVSGLVNFLARNDCSQMRNPAFEACYERTRLRLIQTTQSLEEAEYRINQLTTRRGKVM